MGFQRLSHVAEKVGQVLHRIVVAVLLHGGGERDEASGAEHDPPAGENLRHMGIFENQVDHARLSYVAQPAACPSSGTSAQSGTQVGTVSVAASMALVTSSTKAWRTSSLSRTLSCHF